MQVIHIPQDGSFSAYQEIEEGYQPPSYSISNKIAAFTRIAMPIFSSIGMFSSFIAMEYFDNEIEKRSLFGGLFGFFSGIFAVSTIHLSFECCCNSVLKITNVGCSVISALGLFTCAVLQFSLFTDRTPLGFLITSAAAIGATLLSLSHYCCIACYKDPYIAAIRQRLCP